MAIDTIFRIYEIQNIGKGEIISIQPENLLELYNSDIALIWRRDGLEGYHGISTFYNFNVANGNYSLASGFGSASNGYASFVHGYNSVANGNYSIVLGRNITGTTDDTTYVDKLNIKNIPVGTSVNNLGVDANGRVVVGTSGSGGTGSTAYWSASTGPNAIVTLNSTNIASGEYAVALGSGTTASGKVSYAEGVFTISSGYSSHSEGEQTVAGGDSSHAEGYFTKALGFASHAGGDLTQAIGDFSFVHGFLSKANSQSTIVLGASITGTAANTTYVDGLNIRTIGAGPGTIDLGVDATGLVVNQASDIRLKENIQTIDGALNTVQSLRGVTYNWIDREAGGNGLRYGFIAQEVQEVVPELVTENGEYLGVQYKDVPALLVEAIKELTAKVTELENTIIELKNK